MSILNGLNKEQYEAVTHTDGPLLILAGAGTGKTNTLAHKVAYLIEKGVPPYAILLLTFTNKAAGEMKERVNRIVEDNKGNKVTACTFHSFCTMILRQYAKHIGFTGNFTIINESDDADIINLIKSENKSMYDVKGFPSGSNISAIISNAVNRSISLATSIKEYYSSFTPFTDKIIDIYKKYMVYKNKKDMMNYDDLLLYARALLQKHDVLRNMISDAYSYIMVDEYQDTNRLQFDIIKLLRVNNKNITVVGDDMQSLYGFRGATIDNILMFPEFYKKYNCKIIKLVQNYRSTKEILDLSNNVCNKTTEGFKKTLKSADGKRGDKPYVVDIYSQYEEAQYVLNLIKDLISTGAEYKDICILERKALLSTQLELMLDTENIPFKKYGGTKFLESNDVRDIIAYMRVIKNYTDELSWFRILKNHRWIGDVNSRLVSKDCSVNGHKALLSDTYKNKKYYTELHALYDMMLEADRMPLNDLLNFVIDYYLNVMRNNIAEMKTTEDKREAYYDALNILNIRLDILKEIASKYNSITEFLDDISLSQTNKDDVSENSITISTIHSAKGLEFDNVIILDAVDNIFPSTTVMDIGSKEDNEELRCFYVAITRAKKRLYIMIPQIVSIYGQALRGFRTHFLNDIESCFQTMNA